jgi:signal transduction histidine kinase
MNLSLRTKGVLALVVLVLYVAACAWYLASLRADLEIVGQQLASHQAAQATLAPTFKTLAHTLVQTQSILSKPDYSSGVHASYANIGSSLDPLLNRLAGLRGVNAEITHTIDNLFAAVDAVRRSPSGDNLSLVRNAEQELIAQLNDVLGALEHRSAVLAEDYHDKQQAISLTAVGTSVIGALATAIVILVFFTRLARDLQRLEERSAAIVSGYSGPPLRNRRHDEVGRLIEAVNRMQSDLRNWERQQEIGRQQRFHQEKMAAVGSMAAAIGHEVSNPIAAIAGMAQFLLDETRETTDRAGRLANEFGVQILRQTERISLIMRQLASLTRQHSPEPELLDLNALVRSTCSFISYDKRFRGIEFEYGLDHDLPALLGVADHLTQVLMNLLINAADAMEEVSKDGSARIRVASFVIADTVCLAVADTGHGMTEEVRARAFDESFTTKPAGKGRGIGLFLCKTLIEQAGGQIQVQSTPGAGTTMILHLPLPPAAALAA